MKKLLLSTAAFALLGGAAMAADLPAMESAPMMAPVATAYNWTGFYAGLDAGYSWGNVDASSPAVSNFDADGFLLGAFAGYNYQFGSIVAGGEADIEWTNADGDSDGDSFLEKNWQGSLRGRVGYAIDRFMLFGTAGLAIADFDGDASAALDGHDSGTELGWTVGAGVDVAVTDNIFVRGEYRYADYGKVISNGGQHLDFNDHTVRLGVAYKF